VDELDTVGQFAGYDRRVTIVLSIQSRSYHDFDDARRRAEISRDTPKGKNKTIRSNIRVTDVTPALIHAMASPARPTEAGRQDGCRDDMRNDKMAVKRHVRCHGTQPVPSQPSRRMKPAKRHVPETPTPLPVSVIMSIPEARNWDEEACAMLPPSFG
jgi:hypothetical protein